MLDLRTELHLSEQPAENQSCQVAFGMTPAELQERVLGSPLERLTDRVARLESGDPSPVHRSDAG